MKSYLPIPAFLAVAIIMAGCGPRADQPAAKVPTQAEDEAAIKRLIDDLVAAANARDPGGVAACLTEDAIWLPPNQPARTGKKAIQTSVQTLYDQYTEHLTAHVLEIGIGGPWAFARSAYTQMLTPRDGGQPKEDSGKWLTIAKRQADGSWKSHRDIWNSDRPLPK